MPEPRPSTPSACDPPPPSLGELRELLRDLDAIVWEADATTFVFAFVSAAAERITGHRLEDWYRPDFWAEHIHPEDRDGALAFCRDATVAGRDHAFEYRFRTADGRHLWFRDIVHVVKNPSGEPFQLRGLMVDITQQKLAELSLKVSEDRFRDLLNNLQVGVMVMGAETQTLLYNPAALELLGVTDAEITGRDLYDPRWNVIHEDGSPFPPETFPVVRALSTGREVRNVMMGVFRPRTGDRAWLLVNATPFLDSAGGVRQVIASFGDITERRQMESQLQLLEQAMSRLNEAVIITEAGPMEPPGPPIVYVNDAFERLTGYSRAEVLGVQPGLVTGSQADQEAIQRMAAAIRAGRPVREEMTRRRKNGTEWRVEMDVVPIPDQQGGVGHFVAIERDVTERRRLEEQLRHSQKMEAVGMLAGGIAHDFNNLLTAMLGYSELLLAKTGPGQPSRREAEEIHRAAERAASLTRQLLAFSRKQVLQPRVISLNRLILDLEDMLHRLLGEDIEIQVRLDPALGSVMADRAQMEQVILNLAVNARDAMPHGGTLRIETANEEVGGTLPRRHLVVEPGRYVILGVEDDGIGMDESTRAHIFDPFFTTKGVGRGTGLGLSSVYGVVKQSGGTVGVDSVPGRGTRFTIYMPRVDDAPNPGAAGEPGEGAVGGSETILLVEDEPSVRVLAREALREQGYRVLEAGDGEEALRVAREHAGPIHLLLTDVIMPRLRGRALADRLQQARTDLRVLYMSGYPDTAIAQHGVLGEGVPFLGKPFGPDALLRRVRQVLDAGRVTT
jgi:PAS domain S-box-containing protein